MTERKIEALKARHIQIEELLAADKFMSDVEIQALKKEKLHIKDLLETLLQCPPDGEE